MGVRTSWNKGKKWSKEHKEKLSKIHKESQSCQSWLKKLHKLSKGKHYSPATEFKKGIKPWNFKGRSTHKNGYIWIYSPNHPFCDVRSNVLEHRLVVETQLGRYLTPKEMVHHINKIKGDNRPENLMAFINRSSHVKFEAGKHIESSTIIFDGHH